MSSSPQYRLFYFNSRGLAEVSRILFAAAGVAYTDDRVKSSSESKDWENRRSTTMFGKIPELYVDGKVIPQSKAIERFLARRFGFMGSNDIEAAQIEGFGEYLRDLAMDFYKVRAEEEKKNAFLAKEAHDHLTHLEKHIGDNGHIVGDKLSLADVQLYYTLNFLDNEDKHKLTSKYPKVHKVVEGVKNNEKVANWLKTRPVTAY